MYRELVKLLHVVIGINGNLVCHPHFSPTFRVVIGTSGIKLSSVLRNSMIDPGPGTETLSVLAWHVYVTIVLLTRWYRDQKSTLSIEVGSCMIEVVHRYQKGYCCRQGSSL
jgi:hypothetical protein